MTVKAVACIKVLAVDVNHEGYPGTPY